MLTMLVSALLLPVITTMGSPSPRLRRDADIVAPLAPVVPLVHGGIAAVHPVLYHAPNCTVEEKSITLKKCTPKSEKVCEDVEVPFDVVEYEETCHNITTVVCKPTQPKKVDNDAAVADEMVDEEDTAESMDSTDEESANIVKRNAEPHHLTLGLPVAHHAVVYHTPCQDTEDNVVEQCFKRPVINTTMKTVPVCKIVSSVECEDVEEMVPHTVCTHTHHVVY